MKSRVTFYSMHKKLGYGYDIPLFAGLFYSSEFYILDIRDNRFY